MSSGEANVWQPRTIIEVKADTKLVTQLITALTNQTLFTITDFAYTVGTGALQVYRNGEYLTPNVDFVEQTDTTFSLVIPSTVGDEVVAVGNTGISGTVDVRDTDIFLVNHQALRDYAGIEETIYVQGTVLAGDTGENFFQKITGAAPGTYVDNNDTVIIPTGGDGSIGWIRKTPYVFAGIQKLGYVVADRSEAVLLDISATGRKLFITSDDGGEFTSVFGAAAATYANNSVLYAGTILIPTGGDGSAAWLRKLSTAVDVRSFGAKFDLDMTTGVGTDNATAVQEAVNFQTSARGAGTKLSFPAGAGLVESTITAPASSGGIVWEGSGAYGSNPYTTSRVGPQTLLCWGGAAGGTLVESTSTLNHVINNMTLVGRDSAAGDRAGILLHSKYQAGFANANEYLNAIVFYDADVAMQFADVSGDGNSSDSLFNMVAVLSCDTGLLVKNTQGLNYIFNLYNVDSCKRAVHCEQGGAVVINGCNLSNSGGTGVDDWCFKFDNFGDSSGFCQINDLRLEQDTQQIVKAANLGNIQINGLYEAQGNQAVTMFDLNGVSLTLRDSRLITHDATNPTFMLEWGGGGQMPALVIEDTHFDAATWDMNDWFGYDVNDRVSLFVNRSVYGDQKRESVPFINSIPQNGPVTHRLQTTDATTLNNTLDGNSGNTYNRLQIPVDTVFLVDAYYIGRQSGGSVVGTFHRRATFKNVGGTSSQVGATQTVGSDENAGGWAADITVNDSIDAVRANVTGLAATTIDWVVNMEVKILQ